MKRFFKGAIALSLIIVTLASLLMFTSCEVDFANDVESLIDDILTADSYTIDISYDDGSIYQCKATGDKLYTFKEIDGVEIKNYWYRAEDGKYYEASIVLEDNKQISLEKKEITAQEFAADYTTTIEAHGVLEILFAHRRVLDMAEETDDGFTYYTTKSEDGVGTYRYTYTLEVDGDDLVYISEYNSKNENIVDTTRISAVDDTDFEIPESVLNK